MWLHDKFCWTYVTDLQMEKCINAIQHAPLSFGDNPFNPQYYECILCDSHQILITFKGAKFGKPIHTTYLLTFAKDNDICSIQVKFVQEKWGLFPFISTFHLDIFMRQKIQAHRID